MFIQTHLLTPVQLMQAEELERICKEKEELSVGMLIDSSDNFNPEIPCFFLLYQESIPAVPEKCSLICFLSLYMPSETEAEIRAYTHPDYRRQHCFFSLLRAACHVLKVWNIPNITFPVDGHSAGAKAALKSLNTRHAYSEYLMERDGKASSPLTPIFSDAVLSIADRSRPDVLIQVHSEAFQEEHAVSAEFLTDVLEDPNAALHTYTVGGHSAGICCTASFSNKVMLFGIAIADSYRGKGYGYDMMCRLIAAYPSSLCLHVSSYNEAAVHLYRKLGFSITEQLDYHGIRLPDALETLNAF